MQIFALSYVHKMNCITAIIDVSVCAVCDFGMTIIFYGMLNTLHV